MAEDADEIKSFEETFRAYLSEADEIVLVTLKGHLEVERQLDNVLRINFIHPEYFEKLGLDFGQRVQIAQAYTPAPDARDWRLIHGLNSLRNEIAHGGKNRASKIGELRKILLEAAMPAFREKLRRADEKEVVILAAMMCSGFLAFQEDNAIELRNAIEEWRRKPSESTE
jgi:hypothetical protein